MTLESFSTLLLLAERLTARHPPEVRRMDQNEGFMAHLGAVRREIIYEGLPHVLFRTRAA